MRLLKFPGFFSLLCLIAVSCTHARAQIGIGVNIGPEPVCPYGYFNYAPYNCAPYGYYGPDWFANGIFLGAGPWFHGPHNFWGHVDNRWDPHHGYHGPLPVRGQHPFEGFHGNEAHDGRGHIGPGNHDASREHNPGYVGQGHEGGGHGDSGHGHGDDRGHH